ncbi:MAG TPA: DMT family transporter [bacterium]|nr:DMT family transporter [bacterium]
MAERFHSHIRADLWLLFVTLIWGTSFPLVKTALTDVSPLLFLAIRFALGAVFIFPFVSRKIKGCTKSLFRRGILLGLPMSLGMMLQTLGLQYTTASKSAFLTGLCVVFVPILVIAVEKRTPKKESLAGVVLAVTGIYFLTNPDGGGMNKGDLLTLFCAVSFAFQILFVEMLVRENESDVLTFIMVASTAVLSGIASFLFETPRLHATATLLGALGFLAVFCTAVAFRLQVYWQPRTTATAAAVIYTMESVFAAILAYIFLNERLSASASLGAGMILSGMIFAEFRK